MKDHKEQLIDKVTKIKSALFVHIHRQMGLVYILISLVYASEDVLWQIIRRPRESWLLTSVKSWARSGGKDQRAPAACFHLLK